MGKTIKCIWKISFSSFRKWYGLLNSQLLLARCQPLRIKNCWDFLLIHQDVRNVYLQYLTTVTSKTINHTIFWKNSIRSFRCIYIFQVHLYMLAKLWLIFSVISREYEIWAIFNILIILTVGVNMITILTSFLSSTISALSVSYISFLDLKIFKMQFRRVIPFHYILVLQIDIYMSLGKDEIFKPANMLLNKMRTLD